MSTQSEAGAIPAPGPTMRASRLYMVIAGLYLMQGIPIYLFAAALPTILRTEGVSLTAIGGLATLLLPSILKFLWAPFVDRFALLPIGRRRSWIVPTQAGIVGLILFLSTITPSPDSLKLIFGIAMCVAILSATQDIATDGYATERLTAGQRTFGNAIQATCVALGVFIGNGGTLLVYDAAGWQVAITFIGVIAALALLPVLFMQERAEEGPSRYSRPPSLRAFIARPEAVQMLVFALLYRCSEGLVKAMEQPFLVDQGVPMSIIGLLSGVSAVTVGILASLAAVPLIGLLGLKGFLWLLGITRTFYFLVFAAYTGLGLETPVILGAAVVLDKIVRQMEIVGLYALFMGVCSRDQAGTDFTILSSASLVLFMVGGIAAGSLADSFGFTALFGGATVLSGLCLVFAMRRVPQ